MEEQKLVFKDGTVSVSEDELKKAGYVKLADDEQAVKKVELVKGWATFMEENKHLPFSNSVEGKCFTNAVLNDFCEIEASYREKQELFDLLSRAYFNGYTVKKEPRYYIKLPLMDSMDQFLYLNVYNGRDLFFDGNDQWSGFKCQFTQAEIDGLQKDERVKALDLNALKVRVPDNELED